MEKKFNVGTSYNPNRLRASQIQTAANRIVDRLVEKSSEKFLGINSGTWIFIFFAIGLGVILSVYPIFRDRKELFCLFDMPGGKRGQHGGLALCLIAVFGLLAAFSCKKTLRVIFSCLTIITPCLFFLFSRHIPTPSWGMLVYLCAAVSMVIFACMDDTSLGSYPNPFCDVTAQWRWVYVALCSAAMLFFARGSLMCLNVSWATPVNGWHFIQLLHLSGGEDLWYCLLFIILPVLAGIAMFTKRRIVHLVASLSLLVPAFILMCDKDNKDLNFSTGYYMYILCAVIMIAMTIKPYLADKEKATNEK